MRSHSLSRLLEAGRGRSMHEIVSEIRCPAGCVPGMSNQIKATTREFLGITLEAARAARLNAEDGLFICTRCGCVWRRFFDSYILSYRTIKLGTSTPPTRFCPAPWLNKALSGGDARSDPAPPTRTRRFAHRPTHGGE
jgi:hypothetical protein